MCGIAGIYQLGGENLTSLQQHVDAMTDMLQHRGPNSRGTWLDHDIGVALGHRRLAIRDLSPLGHQPMISACGNFVIVYNGEVYSCTEIKRDLEKIGCTLRGHSDTEVILEACAAWGIERTLPRLIGMFAFALFDRNTRALYLVRDRVGIKPLYWGQFGKLFLFGSELKALRATSGWTPTLDKNALAAFMRHNYIPAPHTIYSGVQKLEPGCYLRLSEDGKTEIKRFWDLRSIVESGTRAPNQQPEDRVINDLDDLLKDAVQRRMVADVPLGSLLSGGIDSSLVTALMAEQSDKAIKTFSIGFSEREFNEAPYAHEIAKHLKTDHTELYVEPSQALALVDKLPYWYDEPFADSSQIPTALVCELTKKYVTVVLSGDGGDELFAGYNRYAYGLKIWQKTQRFPLMLRKCVARMILAMNSRAWDRSTRWLSPHFLPPQFGHKLHKLAHLMNATQPDAMYRQLLSQWDNPDTLVQNSAEPKGILWDETVTQSVPNFLDRMQFLDTMTYLPDDILTKVDRASMRVSLEARVPLLDHRIVSFAWNLPRHFKLRDGKTKWILREILYRRVPKKLIERPKMGFGVPLEQWLRGPLRDWAEELLDARRLKNAGIFDPAPIRKQWEAHLAGNNHAYSLWTVLMAQAWLAANTGLAA